MQSKSVWASAATAFLVGVESFVVAFTAAWVSLTLAFHMQSWKTPTLIIAAAFSFWSAASVFQMSENAARAELELQRIALETATRSSNKRKELTTPTDIDA
ncbi:hypothetical protein PUV54_00265 [Hyphococcus flavus]|uniref:Uncharacterized protein n=1 Tax=Hyphococcus flavus TaxID=1866326 RepID=A0AAE9ZIJ3_9PROT|nr:hypothetical protein [Hyphococcus flavus]WDI31626.1 hypothetical protein PUV54_00265 [Hyphococcus flavus]